MDVSLSSDQDEWQGAVGRLADSYAVTAPDLVREMDLDAGWRDVIRLGIPGLRSVDHSGATESGVECALAVEQVGRRLSPLPLVGQAILVPDLLVAAGATPALDRVVSGQLRLAPAFNEELTDFARLGEPSVAFDAAGATHALVLAGPPDGASLAAVTLASDEIRRGEAAQGLDVTRVLKCLPPDAMVEPLTLGGTVESARLDRTRALAMCMLSADLLGVMTGAVSDAVQYAKDRHQFGVPVGSFQAVQHILADAVVALEGARSCVWHAAWSLDRMELFDVTLAARSAKAYCSAAGLKVVEASVQVFGGIAITWEHLSHVRLRRVHLDRQCFGSEVVQYPAIGALRVSQVA